MDICTGYCPESHLVENELPGHRALLILVRYPKQLEMFDHYKMFDFLNRDRAMRVVFNRPINTKEFNNRDEMYQLIHKYGTFPLFGLTPTGSAMLPYYDSFAFVDHNARIVEYALSHSRNFVLHTQPTTVAVSSIELQTALRDLKYIETVADMYCTTVGSLMTRIAAHNLRNKTNPIVASKEYLYRLETSLIHNETTLRDEAHLWGVHPAVIALWLSENT